MGFKVEEKFRIKTVPIELYDDILFQLKHKLYPQLF
jgi:hypothetical protein